MGDPKLPSMKIDFGDAAMCEKRCRARHGHKCVGIPTIDFSQAPEGEGGWQLRESRHEFVGLVSNHPETAMKEARQLLIDMMDELQQTDASDVLVAAVEAWDAEVSKQIQAQTVDKSL